MEEANKKKALSHHNNSDTALLKYVQKWNQETSNEQGV
jgi:hypothetical protein